MPFPVKLYNDNTRLLVRDIGGYSYTYGKAIPILHEADLTTALEGRTPAEAEYIANMLSFVGSRAIREKGSPLDQGLTGAVPMAGCTMVCFTEEGRGTENARVTLNHTGTGVSVIAYDRTVSGAIRSANAAMRERLKK